LPKAGVLTTIMAMDMNTSPEPEKRTVPRNHETETWKRQYEEMQHSPVEEVHATTREEVAHELEQSESDPSAQD